MDAKTKRKMLAVAFRCLRQPGERRPFFSQHAPTAEELKQLKKGLNGRVGDPLLKRFFPKAYAGVAKHGFLEYFLTVHNKMETLTHHKELKESKLVEWCKVYPAVVFDSSRVKTCDGKMRKITNELYPSVTINVKKGDKVLIHRGANCLKLSNKEYSKAVRLFQNV